MGPCIEVDWTHIERARRVQTEGKCDTVTVVAISDGVKVVEDFALQSGKLDFLGHSSPKRGGRQTGKRQERIADKAEMLLARTSVDASSASIGMC